MSCYIGIDLGGTNIAGGIVDETGRIILSDSVPTPHDCSSDEIMESIVKLAEELVNRSDVEKTDISGIGVGCPGTVDNENGIITYCVNIPMRKVRAAEYIESRLGIRVNLENDANAAALGEYYVNGNGAKSYIFITLGTGIGGGAVLDGKIYRGFNGVGIEAGHMTLVHNGEKCTCGKRGCWERYGSVTALINQTVSAMKANPSSRMSEIAEKYGEVNGRVAFEAAGMGDKAAQAVVDRYIEYVADGITGIINIFEPELLVIGGGISKEGKRLLDPVREYVHKNEFNRYMSKTRIETASLANDAGIIGAALSCASGFRNSVV